MKNDFNATASRQADAELIRRALEGDEGAFATVFNAHKTRIYSLCLRVTGNTAEAEDLTLDAFLHVFRKLDTFRGDSAFSTWLYRAAVNTLLMHFRKRGLREVPLEETDSKKTGVPKREFGRMDKQLSTSVGRIALNRTMKELPVGSRTAFVLHEVKGYEHREIARPLHCSVGNSKSQLHKARARMREILGVQPLPEETQVACGSARPLESATGTGSVVAASPLEWHRNHNVTGSTSGNCDERIEV